MSIYSIGKERQKSTETLKILEDYKSALLKLQEDFINRKCDDTTYIRLRDTLYKETLEKASTFLQKKDLEETIRFKSDAVQFRERYNYLFLSDTENNEINPVRQNLERVSAWFSVKIRPLMKRIEDSRLNFTFTLPGESTLGLISDTMKLQYNRIQESLLTNRLNQEYSRIQKSIAKDVFTRSTELLKQITKEQSELNNPDIDTTDIYRIAINGMNRIVGTSQFFSNGEKQDSTPKKRDEEISSLLRVIEIFGGDSMSRSYSTSIQEMINRLDNPTGDASRDFMNQLYLMYRLSERIINGTEDLDSSITTLENSLALAKREKDRLSSSLKARGSLMDMLRRR